MESEGVAVDRVAAAMLDTNRMIGDGGVEISNGEGAAVGSFGVVVLEAEDPVADGSFGRAFAQSELDGRDGAEIAIDHAEVHESGHGRVRVRVNEAGENGFGGEVNFFGSGSGKVEDVVIGAARMRSPEMAIAWA
jgi:hypothetical protein